MRDHPYPAILLLATGGLVAALAVDAFSRVPRDAPEIIEEARIF
jgi:hypothetical protein